MSVEEIAAQIVSDLGATDRLSRKHASFWNFAKKGPKEMGVFTEAMERIAEDLDGPITGWSPVHPDPPDIELTSGTDTIGVEITELVNPKALKAQLSGSVTYSEELLDYGPDQAKTQIAEIVKEKEEKIGRAIHRYDAAALLIHTDEPMLTSEMFQCYRLSPPSEVYRWVYLLFSYEPAKNECPLVRLQ
jgi:hypothetical protein